MSLRPLIRIRAHRSAFTLLEMSIVLTVIALVAGGALTAQSFIRNAKLSGLMTEGKYYMNAWGQFQEKYKAIPGDMSTASSNWSAASNGDGNGVLVAASTSLVTVGVGTTPEVLYAFQHLALSGIIEGGYNGGTLTSGGRPVVSAGVNVPKGPIDNSVYLFDHPYSATNDNSISGDAMYFDGYYGHVLVIGGKAAPSNGFPNLGILSSEQAYSIDTKFDDGHPDTGNVMAPKNTYFSPSGCTDSAVAGANYLPNSNTAGNQKVCILYVKMP